MQRLIIARMDNQLGPKPLYQYPPAEKNLPKEKFLKIWARHETEEESQFIHFTEKDITYLSLNKKRQNNTYFIVVVIKNRKEEDVRIFQDVLENVSEELIENLDERNFVHMLHESYDTIKNYTQINEEEMFLRLFEDKMRIVILKILQAGTISKSDLKAKLKDKFGYMNVNIEIFLTPLLRLDLIEIRNIHGIKGVIFLKHDVFCCRMPPKNKTRDEKVEKEIIQLFSKPQIIPLNNVRGMVMTLNNIGVRQLINKLTESPQGIPYEKALNIVGNKETVLKTLKKNNFITTDHGSKVHLLSTLKFLKFKPKYLLKELIERFNKKKISAEQLFQQITIMNNGNEAK